MNTPRARALLGSLVVVGALAASTATASAAVVINEVESDDAVVADFVELTNNGAASVDIGGYVIKDSDDGHYVADVDSGPGGFGLGKADSARLPRSTG